MQNGKIKNLWDAFFPILLYVVFSDCVYLLLCTVLGEDALSPMALQILTEVLSSPSVFYFYLSDRTGRRAAKADAVQRKKEQEEKTRRCFFKIAGQAARIALFCAAAVGLSMALNDLILASGIAEHSAGYAQVRASFFSSTLAVELFGTAFVTPVLEETLYRGIVYERLRRFWGALPAIFVSALLFGAVHFNLVQFVYAGAVGIFLAVIYQSEGTLVVPVAAHAAANAVAVIRTETGYLWGSAWQDPGHLPFAALLLLLSFCLTGALTKGHVLKNNREK